MDAALEAIAAPAFLVRLPGDVVRANARGEALLEEEPGAVRAALAACAGAAPPPGAAGAGALPELREIPGAGGHALLVLPGAPDGVRGRAAAAARRWGLTARQREVLALLAEGRSNRAIAAALRCSEKTVEIHVSALLEKAGAEGRAQLVARVWTEG